MSRNEDIDNAIWSDPDFEALSEHATLLYLWSFTNPRCGMAGMYRVSIRGMTESKVPEEHIPDALAELADAGFAFYEGTLLWVRTRVKYLRAKSPQMAKSVANDLLKVPAEHPLRARFLKEYGSAKWLRDELKRTYAEGMGNLSAKPVGKPNPDNVSRTSTEVPGTGTGTGSSKEPPLLPKDFPEELRAHLRAAFRVLRDLAERHNAKVVTPLSLGAVVMTRRHKPLVKAAFDYAAWADGQAQRRKDVVAGYRNWLEKENDLAGIEQLGPDGMPAANGLASSPKRKENASDLLRRFGGGSARADVDLTDADIVEESAA